MTDQKKKTQSAWIRAALAMLAAVGPSPGRRPSLPSSNPKPRPAAPLNRPCPCGSGHKYKKCCYRRLCS